MRLRDQIETKPMIKKQGNVNLKSCGSQLVSETDGFVVDLTPAILLNLGDGAAIYQDQIFQVINIKES
jgi:hypothetical protein